MENIRREPQVRARPLRQPQHHLSPSTQQLIEAWAPRGVQWEISPLLANSKVAAMEIEGVELAP
jgi:hypothetical protein